MKETARGAHLENYYYFLPRVRFFDATLRILNVWCANYGGKGKQANYAGRTHKLTSNMCKRFHSCLPEIHGSAVCVLLLIFILNIIALDGERSTFLEQNKQREVSL
jgi:hypothetical protein